MRLDRSRLVKLAQPWLGSFIFFIFLEISRYKPAADLGVWASVKDAIRSVSKATVQFESVDSFKTESFVFEQRADMLDGAAQSDLKFDEVLCPRIVAVCSVLRAAIAACASFVRRWDLHLSSHSHHRD